MLLNVLILSPELKARRYQTKTIFFMMCCYWIRPLSLIHLILTLVDKMCLLLMEMSFFVSKLKLELKLIWSFHNHESIFLLINFIKVPYIFWLNMSSLCRFCLSLESTHGLWGFFGNMSPSGSVFIWEGGWFIPLVARTGNGIGPWSIIMLPWPETRNIT